MPKPRLTTEAAPQLELSPKLLTKAKKQLNIYIDKKLATDAAKAEEIKAKDDLEQLITDAGEREAIEAGIRITDALGRPIPIKVVKGETSVFDEKAFLKHYRLPADCFEKFTKKVPKKEYLNIALPKEKP